MTTIFTNGKIVTPPDVIECGVVIVSDRGLIEYVGSKEDSPMIDGSEVDLGGTILAPGFIDIHVHGGYGVNFEQSENLSTALHIYSNWIVTRGVTGYLCSIAAPDHQSLVNLINSYVPILKEGVNGAEVLGLHLEGPYLNNNKKKGAFDPSWLREPSLEEVLEYIETSEGWIRQMTMDPELPGAKEVASLLKSAGIVVALGHTNSDYELATEALRGNFTHVTHTFNAQKGFNHRAPGVFGAVLTSDQVTAELILDNIHVHPGAMKVLHRCVGTDRIVLVTDAMPGAGFGDGTYDLVGHLVTVKENKATLEDGTLAGSIATMDECVRNAVRDVGIPLNHAVQMASLNAARSMGFADRLGSITQGKAASFVVIDEDVNIYLTMVKGKIVYNNL